MRTVADIVALTLQTLLPSRIRKSLPTLGSSYLQMEIYLVRDLRITWRGKQSSGIKNQEDKGLGSVHLALPIPSGALKPLSRLWITKKTELPNFRELP